ncbi:MAG: ShlB/FhaC/HecB family hemolysin secretion/activation protein [Gammaproteobacteria bacterium]
MTAIFNGFSSQSAAEVLDPTRAQKLIQEPAGLDEAKRPGTFDLPPVPKPRDISPTGEVVVIKQVRVTGNTVFSQEELETTTKEFLNREIRASDIEMIRRKVSQYYADHGYINSGAVLESQSLADGVLDLKIIEGRLTEVRQRGQERLQDSYIRDRLIVGSGDPLNLKDLQDSYRLLLGDRLIEQLNGRLLPGHRPGEAILDVNISRARPYQLYFSADDYQTPSVGGYTGRIGGWVDNLLTLGERIDAQFIASGGALGYNTGINLPLNAYDTRFNFRYSDITSSIVEQPINTLNITNHVVGFDAGLSHPIFRTFTDDLTLGVNFVVRKNRTLLGDICAGIQGFGLDCDTQVTVLRMSQHYSHRGDNNAMVFWSTFNVGLDALGATKNSPDLQSGQFFSWLGQSMFSRRLLDDGTHLLVKANIQLADRPLLSLERYSVGGVYTVRGYRENTFVRDNGFNTSVELHYPIYSDTLSGNGSLHLVPFLDYGGAWNNETNALGKQSTDYLFSAGVGFNWQFRQLSVDFYWAHAFTPIPNPVQREHSIQDDGIHFRVNINAF